MRIPQYLYCKGSFMWYCKKYVFESEFFNKAECVQNKIISLFSHDYWSYIPLTLCVCVFKFMFYFDCLNFVIINLFESLCICSVADCLYNGETIYFKTCFVLSCLLITFHFPLYYMLRICFLFTLIISTAHLLSNTQWHRLKQFV